MNISSKGIALIKRYEGLRLKAYLCPAGVPTIGYGTIRYPDDRPVQMGDRISEQQAELFLIEECNAIAKQLAKLVTVSLNQNQIDALISFCYNLGCGALSCSTLLKKLNQGDYPGAAQEFSRWVNITENGVKKPLEGLIKRRAEEKRLFETVGDEGEPTLVEPSPQEQVTWLEAYRSNQGQTIIAAWKDSELVELVTLDRAFKEDLISVLSLYKNARNLHVAPPEKPIPEAKIINFLGAEPETSQPFAPQPALDSLLVRGSEGEEVKWLQKRLQELGCYDGEIDGCFGLITDNAVRVFQAHVFGSPEADGKVGPLTWKALSGESPIVPPEPYLDAGGGTYLRLTKTNAMDQFGLFKLHLAYIKNGKEVDHIFVCSGIKSKQNFRIGKCSQSGSYEPLPEGKWHIHDMLWVNGKDNYNASWSDGLGPVKINLDYKGPDYTKRRYIQIHIDWNRFKRYSRMTVSPGTAGCIGVYHEADFKRLATWLRETDPRDLYVDWGLGTCPKPTVSVQPVMT